MTAPADERVPFYRLSGADLVFLVFVVLVFRGAHDTMLDDPGLGWHLRNIDAMRDAGGWLTQDPFTYPHDGEVKEWRTNQWLGELPLWLGWKWAGEEGIAAVVSVVLALMLRCLYRMLLRDGVPWPMAVMWTFLAALGTQVSWVARPNVFTMLFLLWTVRVCDLFHQGRCSRRFTLWLLPLFAVWANAHGGFIAGLLTLGATLAIEVTLALFALSADQRSAARSRALHLGLLVVGCVLATLVNPYGWALYPWVLKLLGDPYFMNLNREWWSPDFHSPGSLRFEMLILLYPAILALSRCRPNLVELGLGVMWLHFALSGFRYVPLWVLVAVPTMARSMLELPWLEAATGRLAAPGSTGLFVPRTAPAGWAWNLIAAVLCLGGVKTLERQVARHNPKFIPAAALNKLLELHSQRPQARVFHAYDWGGYLTWHGWPSFLNWIDDRNEVQGEGWIREWNGIVTAEPGWQDKLDAANVELIALQAGEDAPPLTLLLSDPTACPKRHTLQLGGLDFSVPEWQEVYRDDHAVIFQRPPPIH